MGPEPADPSVRKEPPLAGELTIIIPSHDGAQRLPETLSGLASGPGPDGGLEVIVVDDGSAEPLPKDLGQDLPLELRIVHLETNRGRAAACNAGLAEASGRVVLVLDDDMTLAPGGPAGHAAAHTATDTPRAVIGRIDPDPSFFTGRFGRFLAEEEAARRRRLLASPEDVSFENCLTGHFSLPRAVLVEAGGYDESFSRYGFEDIELGWRLAGRGVRLTFRDDLVARHRSDHAGFSVHCRRHRDAGAMAAVFAASSDDPQVRAYLRVEGVHLSAGATGFQRLMAAANRLGRGTPGPLREPLLVAGRAGVRLLEGLAPRRPLHAAYHLVRAMHYAAGLAEATRRGV